MHQKDLNRSLFNTKVHKKCYKKYLDRWYNQNVRNASKNDPNNSVSSPMLINDENHISDQQIVIKNHDVNRENCEKDDDEEDALDYDDNDMVTLSIQN